MVPEEKKAVAESPVVATQATEEIQTLPSATSGKVKVLVLEPGVEAVKMTSLVPFSKTKVPAEVIRKTWERVPFSTVLKERSASRPAWSASVQEAST
jgi:hypothetical protein